MLRDCNSSLYITFSTLLHVLVKKKKTWKWFFDIFLYFNTLTKHQFTALHIISSAFCMWSWQLNLLCVRRCLKNNHHIKQHEFRWIGEIRGAQKSMMSVFKLFHAVSSTHFHKKTKCFLILDIYMSHSTATLVQIPQWKRTKSTSSMSFQLHFYIKLLLLLHTFEVQQKFDLVCDDKVSRKYELHISLNYIFPLWNWPESKLRAVSHEEL